MEAVSYSYLEKPTGGGGTSPPSSRDRVKGTVNFPFKIWLNSRWVCYEWMTSSCCLPYQQVWTAAAAYRVNKYGQDDSFYPKVKEFSL